MQQTVQQPGNQTEQAIQAPEVTGILAGIDMHYITPGDAVFEETPGRLLSLRLNGTEYPQVSLYRSFPHQNPERFISVRDADAKEIGMIRDLTGFDAATQDLLRRFIGLRYFAPKISKLVSLRDEFGYTFWNVETDRGNCRFVVRRDSSEVRLVAHDKVVIVDLDGNRFVIPDYKALTEKERRMLEIYI